MEKTISPEERIKRAEEIYYRRRLRDNSVRMSSAHVTEGRENRQYSLYKKMALQILICILIYLVFSLIKDANYLFSDDLINKAKEILNTDINFQNVSEQIGNFYQNNKDKFDFFGSWLNDNQSQEQNSNEENLNEQNTNDQNTNEQNTNEQNTNEQNINEQNMNEENQNEDKNETEDANTVQDNNENTTQTTDTVPNEENKNNENVGIGGASNNEQAVYVNAGTTGNKTQTQMQIDAEYIKKNFKMVLPAKATITSHYGKREPTEIISENHQGIDIGVVVGTKVVAAMDGTVSEVSDKGDYGIHLKITNKDVTTIYAHCSKITVKEGQKVKKGQKIALSGNTGNTTGPHLHFEIRRAERTVNPELILSWS